jgi:hypothetical protein
MGFVRKKASQINNVRKSFHKEVERGIKNPDVWKAAALIAAPYAIGAIGIGAGATAAGGGGFFSTVATGGKLLATGAKAGLAAGGSNIMSLFGGGADGQPSEEGAGFFNSIVDKAKSYASGMTGDIQAKMKDPKYIADLIMRAGSNLAGSAIAGDGLSDEERKLMNALSGDLDALRSNDAKLFDQKMTLAQEVIQQGRAIDPEQVGLKAQRDVQVAGGVQMRDADREAKMREGGRGLSAADRRRAGLEITSDAQSAYLQGLESGQDKKTKTLAAGAALVPANAPTGALNAGLDLASRLNVQEDRRRTAAADTGTMIQDTFGHDKAKSTGGLDLPGEIKDAGKEVINKVIEKPTEHLDKEKV